MIYWYNELGELIVCDFWPLCLYVDKFKTCQYREWWISN